MKRSKRNWLQCLLLTKKTISSSAYILSYLIKNTKQSRGVNYVKGNAQYPEIKTLVNTTLGVKRGFK